MATATPQSEQNKTKDAKPEAQAPRSAPAPKPAQPVYTDWAAI